MTATTTRPSIVPRPRDLLDGPTTELLCMLSLVVVVLNTNEDPVLFLPAIVALAVGLLRPTWPRHPGWWLTVGALLAIRQASDWEGVDNHVVVTTYWCLALGLGLLARDRGATLARSARLLIGLVFGFAVAWKFLSPDFVNGDFFRFTLLVDERFESVARHVGGVGASEHAQNRAQLAELYAAIPSSGVAQLSLGARIGLVATAMTWFAIVTESLIAVAHLAPLRGRWTLARPVTLLGFCVGTYLVVPVGGFGCLLVTMALADEDLPPRWRAALLALFAGLVVYGPLWRVLAG